MEDRPKKIKMEIFPADNIECDDLLDELQRFGFIIRYEAKGGRFVQVVNFAKHQMPHHKEAQSTIPAPEGLPQITRHAYDVSPDKREAVFRRDGEKCLRCGTTESLSIDHIVPLADGGDNSTKNLQTLCKSCNSSKGGTTKDYRKPNVGSTLIQRNINVDAPCPSDSLNPDSLNPDCLIPPPTPPPHGGTTRAKKLPDDFAVTDDMAAWFSKQGFRIDIRAATEEFVDHWRGTGKPMKDWAATWRNSMRKQNQWAGNGRHGPRKGATVEHNGRLVSRAGMVAAKACEQAYRELYGEDEDNERPLESPFGRHDIDGG